MAGNQEFTRYRLPEAKGAPKRKQTASDFVGDRLGQLAQVAGPLAFLGAAAPMALKYVDALTMPRLLPAEEKKAAASKKAPTSPAFDMPAVAKRNPEQAMLDTILGAGGKWSLNMLGAAAKMREAPGSPPPMKDVVMGEALQLADLDWQRRSAAAMALEGAAGDAAMEDAIARRQAMLTQLLGQGISLGLPEE